MKTSTKNPFIHAASIALTIATLTGIAGTPFDSIALGETTINSQIADDNHDAKAIEVIEQSIEALGGREKIEEVKSLKQTGTLSVPAMQMSGVIEIYSTSPDFLLVKLDLPGMGVTLTGLNKGVTWSSDAMNGPRLMTELESKDLIEQADAQAMLKFAEDNLIIEYQGEVDFDGHKAHKVRFVDHDGDESTSYYDVKAHHQIGLEKTTNSQMGPIKTVTMMREYKEMGGYIQPTKVVQMMGPTEVVFSFTAAEYNKVEESVYALPDAVKALVKATEAKKNAKP